MLSRGYRSLSAVSGSLKAAVRGVSTVARDNDHFSDCQLAHAQALSRWPMLCS